MVKSNSDIRMNLEANLPNIFITDKQTIHYKYKKLLKELRAIDLEVLLLEDRRKNLLQEKIYLEEELSKDEDETE